MWRKGDRAYYLSSPINLKILLPTSLVHTSPEIYYPLHQTDDNQSATDPSHPPPLFSLSCLFCCCRKSLFLPKMCWQQENSLRLKNLEILGLWSDVWELTSQLFIIFLHQPHRSWAVSALTPLQTTSPSLVLPLAIGKTSVGVKASPCLMATHFCLFSFFFLSSVNL